MFDFLARFRSHVRDEPETALADSLFSGDFLGSQKDFRQDFDVFLD
jgi:hypothetical protein